MKVRPFILPVLATCCAINPVIAKDWQDDKTSQISVNPTQVHELMEHPVPPCISVDHISGTHCIKLN